MSYAYIEPRPIGPSHHDRFQAADDERHQFPARIDLCRGNVPAALDRDTTRFVSASRNSRSTQAFRPTFSPADWRTFASFCIARQLPANFRVLTPGHTDRALRFVVEGTLLQAPAASTRVLATRPAELSAGTIVGEQVLFAEEPGELDVRALEDSLVLELSWPRHKELSAAYPELAFEMLRAAGAVIATRHRTLLGCGDQQERR